MIDVLVTCGGGLQGLTLYKALNNISGLSLHLFDVNDENISKYFFDFTTICFPVKESQKYIEQIENYTIQNKIKFIFPATSFDLEVLSKLKEFFKAKYDCIIVTPDLNYLAIFNDKVKSYEFLKENGFNTQELIDVKLPLNFSVLGKPNIGWGSKGIKIFDKVSDLEGFDTENYHFVQYYNSIEEFSIDFSVNQIGICSEPIIRKRTIVSGGFSVITETNQEYDVNFMEFKQLVKKAFSKVGAIGIYNLQFIKNTNEETYFTDLNARIGTSCVISNYLSQSILSSFFNSEQQPIANVKSVRYLAEKYYVKLNPNLNIKAIVFDLDDTLISNKQFILSRCVLFFNKLKIEGTTIEDFKIYILALLNEGKAPILLNELKRNYKLVQDVNELIELYRTCYPEKMEVYKDVLSTLAYLKSKQYKIFLLTDNPKRTQEIKINMIPEVMASFDAVFFTADLNTEKPDFLCFNKVSEVSKISLNQMVMVGDNEYRDIYGALQSGFAFAFKVVRQDSIVSQSIMEYHFMKTNGCEIDSLQALKFIL
jgi:putative hydrolase of the HAD superfamily